MYQGVGGLIQTATVWNLPWTRLWSWQAEWNNPFASCHYLLIPVSEDVWSFQYVMDRPRISWNTSRIQEGIKSSIPVQLNTPITSYTLAHQTRSQLSTNVRPAFTFFSAPHLWRHLSALATAPAFLLTEHADLAMETINKYNNLDWLFNYGDHSKSWEAEVRKDLKSPSVHLVRMASVVQDELHQHHNVLIRTTAHTQ